MELNIRYSIEKDIFNNEVTRFEAKKYLIYKLAQSFSEKIAEMIVNDEIKVTDNKEGDIYLTYHYRLNLLTDKEMNDIIDKSVNEARRQMERHEPVVFTEIK